jgi:hypothetical protein
MAQGISRGAIEDADAEAVIKPKPLQAPVEGGFTVDDFTVEEEAGGGRRLRPGGCILAFVGMVAEVVMASRLVRVNPVTVNDMLVPKAATISSSRSSVICCIRGRRSRMRRLVNFAATREATGCAPGGAW